LRRGAVAAAGLAARSSMNFHASRLRDPRPEEKFTRARDRAGGQFGEPLRGAEEAAYFAYFIGEREASEVVRF